MESTYFYLPGSSVRTQCKLRNVPQGAAGSLAVFESTQGKDFYSLLSISVIDCAWSNANGNARESGSTEAGGLQADSYRRNPGDFTGVARLLWARQHRTLQLGHWQHVIFMDESRFILERRDGRQRVRRLAVESILDDCVHETTQGGGGSVMVWAGIHYGGKTPLVVPDGNGVFVVVVVVVDVFFSCNIEMRSCTSQPSSWWLAAACHLSVVFVCGLIVSVVVVVDDIVEEFGVNTGLVGLLMTMYSIFFGLLSPVTTYLSKFFRAGSLIMMGAMMTSFGLILASMARHLILVGIGYAFFAGGGAGTVYTAAVGTIRQSYDKKRYVLANGVTISGVSTAMFVFPPVIRLLVDRYGWRGALFICGAITLHSVLMGCLIRMRQKQQHAIRKDYKIECSQKYSDRKETYATKSSISRSFDSTRHAHPTTKGIDQIGGNSCSLSGCLSEEQTLRLRSDEENDTKKYQSPEWTEQWLSIPSVSGEDIGNNQDCAPMRTSPWCRSHEILNSNTNHISAYEERSPYDDEIDSLKSDSCVSLSSDLSYHGKTEENCQNDATSSSNSRNFSWKILTCHVILLFAVFLLAFCYIPLAVYIPSAATHSGLTPMRAASVLSAVGISQAVGRFGNGILVAKGLATATQLYVGMQILMAVSCVLMALWMKIYAIAILGASGFGLAAGSLICLNIVMQRVIDEQAKPVWMGWLILVEGIGGTCGAFALGWLKDLTDKYTATFSSASSLSFVGLLLTLIISFLKAKEKQAVSAEDPSQSS
ncbi:uncharacterized protein [Diadema setosum]|uniref:uncharacterized protein n=1 Tax=Diadema setosum TaxID=31175 RepID=UPI003B3A70A4